MYSATVPKTFLLLVLCWKVSTGFTILENNTGFVDYPHGSSTFPDHDQQSWLIRPNTGGPVTLLFTQFYLEGSNRDTVTVYDGDSSSSPVIGTYSGYTVPNALRSTGDSLYIVFQSDGDHRYHGFAFVWNVKAFPASQSAATAKRRSTAPAPAWS